jgi:lambda repressor-like predicted transcriptional regulator
VKAKLYKTYLFRDKCPSIDYLRTAKAKAGIKNAKISINSGVAAGTLNNWFNGTTRRPQFATIVAAARGIGPEGVDALARCVRDGGKKV